MLVVVGISKGSVTLGPVEGGNLDARNRDKDDPFSYMRKSPNALKSFNFTKPNNELHESIIALLRGKTYYRPRTIAGPILGLIRQELKFQNCLKEVSSGEIESKCR